MKNFLFSTIALLFSLLISPASTLAADCDFDKKVGSCSASIVVNSTGGSKPSYSAEITVRSSAPTCSKVEYFLDSTPNTTILRNTNSEPESLFGTGPITKKNIKIKRCTAFEDKQSAATGKSADGPRFFAGNWSGRVGWLMVSAPLELNIAVNGNQATGTSVDPRNGETLPIRGTVSGNVLTYTFNEPISGDPVNVRLTKKSTDSLTYSSNGSGITFSGTMTRR